MGLKVAGVFAIVLLAVCTTSAYSKSISDDLAAKVRDEDPIAIGELAREKREVAVEAAAAKSSKKTAKTTPAPEAEDEEEEEGPEEETEGSEAPIDRSSDDDDNGDFEVDEVEDEENTSVTTQKPKRKEGGKKKKQPKVDLDTRINDNEDPDNDNKTANEDPSQPMMASPSQDGVPYMLVPMGPYGPMIPSPFFSNFGGGAAGPNFASASASSSVGPNGASTYTSTYPGNAQGSFVGNRGGFGGNYNPNPYVPQNYGYQQPSFPYFPNYYNPQPQPFFNGFYNPGWNQFQQIQQQIERQRQQLYAQIEAQRQSFLNNNNVDTQSNSGFHAVPQVATSGISLGPRGGFQFGEISPASPPFESRFGGDIPAPAGGSNGVFSSSSSSSVVGADGQAKNFKFASTGLTQDGRIVSQKTVAGP